jgi:hypothetical protein
LASSFLERLADGSGTDMGGGDCKKQIVSKSAVVKKWRLISIRFC